MDQYVPAARATRHGRNRRGSSCPLRHRRSPDRTRVPRTTELRYNPQQTLNAQSRRTHVFMVRSVLAFVASGTSLTCTPTRVWDRKGPIWCVRELRSGSPALRLARSTHCIIVDVFALAPAASRPVTAWPNFLAAAPERQTGHVVTRRLALHCQSEGSGKGERTAARCLTPAGVDLSPAMIASRYASRWLTDDHQNRCR